MILTIILSFGVVYLFINAAVLMHKLDGDMLIQDSELGLGLPDLLSDVMEGGEE